MCIAFFYRASLWREIFSSLNTLKKKMIKIKLMMIILLFLLKIAFHVQQVLLVRKYFRGWHFPFVLINSFIANKQTMISRHMCKGMSILHKRNKNKICSFFSCYDKLKTPSHDFIIQSQIEQNNVAIATSIKNKIKTSWWFVIF